MVKKVLIFIFFVNICVWSFLVWAKYKNMELKLAQNNTKVNLHTSTAIPAIPPPSPSPRPIPIGILIPSLNISTTIEPVGVTQSGNMDVPKNAANVGWFEYGPIPGDLGNAVITGHYDTPTGRPAVFYYLKKLKSGDDIEVSFNNSTTRTFTVITTSEVPFSNTTDKYTDYIFVSRPGNNLNLITCDGVWNPTKKTYSTRLVVYTSLKR